MSHISDLQRTLGVPQSEKWDTATQAAVTAYQAASGMSPSGLPTPAVLGKLTVYNPVELAPRGVRDMVSGARDNPPSLFGVGLLTSLNQVPWYVYLGIGVASVGFATLAFRRHLKNK